MLATVIETALFSERQLNTLWRCDVFCIKYGEKELFNTKFERPFSNKERSATDQTNVENLLEKVSRKVIKT